MTTPEEKRGKVQESAPPLRTPSGTDGNNATGQQGKQGPESSTVVPEKARSLFTLHVELSQELQAECIDILQRVQVSLGKLAAKDRSTKEKAMAHIRAETLGRDQPLQDEALQAMFIELLKPLLLKFEDPMERIRSPAVAMVTEFLQRFQKKPDSVQYLPYLLPALVRRLGHKEVTEPSEELRLALMNLLEVVVAKAGADLSIYIDELTEILKRTIVDAFPEVKRMGCRCTALIAKALPERFHMVSKQLVEPLVATLSHQHSRVRNVCIRAIGALVTYGASDALEDVRVPLAQMTLDPNPKVRRSLYTVAGRWLCDYKDRYSFWHKILPLLLTGETDDVEEIRVLANEAFIKAGRTYELENEEQLKEKLEFGERRSDSIPLGCIDLVQQNFSKIYPGLMKDLVDWSAPKRRQSSRLLLTLLKYEGSHVTMHLQKVLGGLCEGVMDEEDDIAENCCQCCELVGSVVAVEGWAKTQLSQLTSTSLSQRAKCSTLIVVGSLTKTAPIDDLIGNADLFASVLSHPSVCQAEDKETQEEFIITLNVVFDRFNDALAAHSQQYFNAIVHLLASTHAKEDAQKLMLKLAQAQHLENVDALYRRHTEKLIENLSSSADAWSKYSLERRVFTTLLANAGGVLGKLLDKFMRVFTINTHPDKDIEVRASFFTLLGKLLTSASQSINSENAFSAHVVTVIVDIIAPSLVWAGGEKASALRTAAVSCLWALFAADLVTFDHLDQSMETLLPKMVSCLSDESEQTRLITAKALERLIPLYKPGFKGSYQGYDTFHSLYNPLLMLLNDGSNDIRKQVCRVWVQYFDIMKQGYNKQLYKSHIQEIFTNILPHLDDENADIRGCVKAALEEAVDVDPDTLKAIVKGSMDKHMYSKDLCRTIIKLCE